MGRLFLKKLVITGAILFAANPLWISEGYALPAETSSAALASIQRAHQWMYVGSTKANYLTNELQTNKKLSLSDREALLEAITTEKKPKGVSPELFKTVVAIDTQFKGAAREKGLETLFKATLPTMNLREAHFMFNNMHAMSTRNETAKKYFDAHVGSLSTPEAITLAQYLSMGSFRGDAALNEALEKYFDVNLDRLSKAEAQQLLASLGQPTLSIPLPVHELDIEIPLNFIRNSGKKTSQRMQARWTGRARAR